MKNCLFVFQFKERKIPKTAKMSKVNGFPLPVCDMKGFLLKNTHVSVSQKTNGAKNRNAISNAPDASSILFLVESFRNAGKKNSAIGIQAVKRVAMIAPITRIVEIK